jgi:GH15 family glucan-1,4-alpha-glucosidase
VENEASFVLTRPVHMVFGTDEPFEGALEATCREFCHRTHTYWLEWVRRLAFSFDWQDEIIRAGITLKLSNFEETGAIVAALTTSIPEGPRSGRTWDYRYCWMRDAFFVVRALNSIGATRTMEDFISYILSIAAGHAGAVRPFYGVVPTNPVEESHAEALAGYGGDGPVRIGNAAALQEQHDVYGSIIMAATPDDFGLPETAFLICRFWLIDALWDSGRCEEARDMFVDALRLRNRYGLLSEDVHPATGKLWGNFPQTYSMSGLILTAIKLSRSWGDRYWRGSS